MTSEEFYRRNEYREGDPTNETIEFLYGWCGLDRGYFCKVSMNGLCVEDFANTKSGALRRARRAWRKTNNKRHQDKYGYPRICGKES